MAARQRQRPAHGRRGGRLAQLPVGGQRRARLIAHGPGREVVGDAAQLADPAGVQVLVDDLQDAARDHRAAAGGDRRGPVGAADRLADPLLHAAHDLAAQRRAVAADGQDVDQQQPCVIGARDDRGGQPAHHALKALVHAARIARAGAHHAQDLLDGLCERRLPRRHEARLAVGEQRVERVARDLRLGGDVGDARVGVAIARDDCHHRLLQACALQTRAPPQDPVRWPRGAACATWLVGWTPCEIDDTGSAFRKRLLRSASYHLQAAKKDTSRR